MLMVLNIVECGKMICSMVKVKNTGLMEANTLVIISRVKKTALANIGGLMVVGMRANGFKIRLKARELIIGMMVENM